MAGCGQRGQHAGGGDADGEDHTPEAAAEEAELIGVGRIHDECQHDSDHHSTDADADHPQSAAVESTAVALHRFVAGSAPCRDACQRPDGDDCPPQPIRCRAVGRQEHDEAEQRRRNSTGERTGRRPRRRLGPSRVAHLQQPQQQCDAGQYEQPRPRPVAAVPDVLVADPLGAEDVVPEGVALRLIETLDDDLVGEQLAEAELGTDEDEERAQRHDEAGQRRAFDQRAVEPADRQCEAQRQRHGQVQAEARAPELAHLAAHQNDEYGGGAGHRARRQVELAADHQQRHRHRHDAEQRCDVEEVGCAPGGAEGLRCQPEQQPHAGEAQQRTYLRTGEQLLDGPAIREPFIGPAGGEGRHGEGYLVPSLTSAATSAALSGVTKPGPVRIGKPPPAVFWFVACRCMRMTGM